MNDRPTGLNPWEIPVTAEEDEMFAERKSFADILTEWENREVNRKTTTPEPDWGSYSFELGEVDENGEIHEISLVKKPRESFKGPLPRPSDELLPMEELMNWWTEVGYQDAQLVTQKYLEYGNTALLEVGQQLMDLLGWEGTKGDAQELGIWFFMVGKMARWKTSLKQRKSVSKDTLDDLAVYATMARRVREKGGWPS